MACQTGKIVDSIISENDLNARGREQANISFIFVYNF